MNTEDFENQLRRARMREMPEGWRAEILSRAEGGGMRAEVSAPARGSWWRDLLWPNPLAWAALVCIWCGILVSNTAGHSLQRQPVATTNTEIFMLRLALERSLEENRGMTGL